MNEHPNHDNSHFYHDDDSVQRGAYGSYSTNGHGSKAATNGDETTAPPQLTVPDRFAIYADSEATEDVPDKELIAGTAFDLANVLAWGLEDHEAAVAYRQSPAGEHGGHFTASSADRVCALLDLAGHGPLRVLYI